MHLEKKKNCVSQKDFIQFFYKIYMEKLFEDLFLVSKMFKQY